MSVDISYSSFNPVQADESWKNFGTDIVPVLAYYIEKSKGRLEVQSHAEMIQKRWDTIFLPQLEKKRREIFKRYEEEGLYIPGVDWNEDHGITQDGEEFHTTEDEKLDYLLNYGPLYPKGHFKGGPVQGKLMYTDDKKEYQDLDVKLKSEWENSNQTAPELPPSSIQLSERQAKLNLGMDFIREGEVDQEYVLSNLLRVDLFYGTISQSEFPESANQYEPIVEEYGLYAGNEIKEFVGNKEVWFGIYSDLNPSTIQQHARQISVETGWGAEDCEQYIREFFLGMKAIVRDLKNDPNTILLREVSGDVEPEAVNALLQQRAKKHYEEYRKILSHK